MSEPLRLIAPPAVEPVSLGQFKALLRIAPGDMSRDSTLNLFLRAARHSCERYCRIAIITQTWLWRMDSFPRVSVTYNRNGFPQLPLPKPPFQSLDWFQYVDTSGTVQTLTRDTSYGQNPASPFYGYQMTPGGGIMPARLTPPWARPWPPQIMVPANTLVQFRAGYGGPLTVSIAAGSKILTVAGGFTFNPDDAPSLVGDTGTKIGIPGAGGANLTLNTTVASVDLNGVATLAAPAVATVAGVTAWLGDPVPDDLQLAILFLAQFYHEQGAVVDAIQPRVVDSLRNGGFRNLVS